MRSARPISNACSRSIARAARVARSIGLGINAGHDLNTKNLPAYVKSVHGLQEVSIGHALFCDAIYMGLKRTVGLSESDRIAPLAVKRAKRYK